MNTHKTAFTAKGFESDFYWYAKGCIFISLMFYAFIKNTKSASRMEEAV